MKTSESVFDVDENAEVIPFSYEITALGADFTVDGIIKQLREDNMFILLFSLPADLDTVRF